MKEDKRAVDTLINFVVNTITQMTKNLQYDRSIIAKVTNILGNNKYEVSHGGVHYSPTSLNNQEYVVGDRVVVTFLQGVLNNSIIIGRVVS